VREERERKGWEEGRRRRTMVFGCDSVLDKNECKELLDFNVRLFANSLLEYRILGQWPRSVAWSRVRRRRVESLEVQALA
jgi:hypothetical protein